MRSRVPRHSVQSWGAEGAVAQAHVNEVTEQQIAVESVVAAAHRMKNHQELQESLYQLATHR